MILILKTGIMDPVMQCTTLPSHSESLKRFLFHFSRRSTRFYRLSHSEIVDIEKVAVRSSLRLPNNKCALIEDSVMRDANVHLQWMLLGLFAELNIEEGVPVGLAGLGAAVVEMEKQHMVED
ncbi:hypothetical protein Tco_1313225 [Tanacetum coccineum]